jgi:hypothetical protein
MKTKRHILQNQPKCHFTPLHIFLTPNFDVFLLKRYSSSKLFYKRMQSTPLHSVFFYLPVCFCAFQMVSFLCISWLEVYKHFLPLLCVLHSSTYNLCGWFKETRDNVRILNIWGENQTEDLCNVTQGCQPLSTIVRFQMMKRQRIVATICGVIKES